ncbi:hypothetical protein CDL12_23259 [Handroanthus impetiginosus]|uniref:Calcineurin-like phosphoesterase domain-containing protein n=1 Tax=Handroanthus impetiginosus TaxID=429701 RepID=A0A2G9GFZ5_9LAMI|nr:hypothetical protein CDL12_23259 [Handroanthus impetiginosus]
MFSGCTWLHAPPFSCAISSPPPSRFRCSNVPMAASGRIAIVGDVHDDWNLEEDTKALQLLKPDVVLFTGDFGNENVNIVRSISNLDFAKAIILGNHDAWSTQKFSAREKDAVQLQLEFLGDEHVGYRRLDFPNLKLSIVGGRPFSFGGEHLFRKRLLIARYGIHDMDGSAKRIYEAALGTPPDHSLIFLAHNGPTGLGSNVDDICGRDWIIGGGDHGDPDLANAIYQLKETTKLPIKLVAFGHMHKGLAYGNGLRKMIVVGDDDIIYLNGAIVPRVKTNSEGTIRAFTVADMLDGSLEKIAETWVSVVGEKVAIEDEIVLFSKSA